jgi:hypothetical protein
VSESDVDNSLHADQFNVELRLPDSGSSETDVATDKDASLDPAAAVVPKIVGNNRTLLKLSVENHQRS